MARGPATAAAIRCRIERRRRMTSDTVDTVGARGDPSVSQSDHAAATRCRSSDPNVRVGEPPGGEWPRRGAAGRSALPGRQRSIRRRTHRSAGHFRTSRPAGGPDAHGTSLAASQAYDEPGRDSRPIGERRPPAGVPERRAGASASRRSRASASARAERSPAPRRRGTTRRGARRVLANEERRTSRSEVHHLAQCRSPAAHPTTSHVAAASNSATTTAVTARHALAR